MMETYFKAPYAVARSRPGPTGPFLDGFADSLRTRGYADRTTRGHLRAAAHLGVWMKAEDVALAALDDRALDAFAAHLSVCTCVRGNRGVYREARAGARVFLAHLRRGRPERETGAAQGRRATHAPARQVPSPGRAHRGPTGAPIMRS